MAFGPEVGSVSVRVIPNTRGFRNDARNQLRKIARELGDLKVKIVLDDKKLAKQFKDWENKAKRDPVKAPVKADLDEFQKQALKDLKKATAKLDAKIPLTVDGEQARQRIGSQVKDLEDRIKMTLPVETELAADARQQIRREVDLLAQSVQSKSVTIRLDADSTKARAQLLDLYRQIPAMSEENQNKILLQINNARSKEELRAAIAALKTEAAAANIEVSMSVDAGPATSLGAVGAMLSRFSTIGVAAAGALTLVLGPALSLISGALVALPGLLAGVTIPMGALALMTADLAKAFENAHPALKSLLAPLSYLQGQVKESFFAGFLGELNGTANGVTILREAVAALSGPLKNLTGALGEALTSAIKGLLSGDGLEALKTLITNIGDGFRAASPAITKMVTAFAQLAAAMTGKGMVEAFTKLANSFSEWVGKDENIKKVQDALTGLLDVLTSVGPELGKILLDGIKTMGDPNFVKNIKEVVTGILELIRVVAALGNMFASTKEAFLGFLNGGPIGLLVGAFVDALSAMTSGWDSFVSLLGTGLSNAFSGIGAVLTGLWAGITTAMQGAWSNVITYITTMFQQLPQTIQNVIGGIIGVFGNLVSTIASTVGQIPGIVGGIFGQLASIVASSVGSFVAAAAAGFAQLVATIVSAMGEALAAVVSGTGNIVSEVGTLGGRVVSAVSGFVGQMSQAGYDLIMGLAGGIGKAIGAAVTAAKNVASSIVGAVRGIFDSHSPSRVFASIGGDVVQGLTNGIGNNQHMAADRAAQMAQGVVDGARKVITEGIDPIMVDIQLDPAALEQLKKEKDLLDLQSKTLAVQKDQAPDKMAKAALQAQLDQINARKREISLIQEQAEYQKQYGQEVQSTQDMYSQHMQTAMKVPYDFAKTNANQFLNDLGISGQGALPTIANWGLDFGSRFVFNVGNMDQALSMQQNIQRKEAAVRY